MGYNFLCCWDKEAQTPSKTDYQWLITFLLLWSISCAHRYMVYLPLSPLESTNLLPHFTRAWKQTATLSQQLSSSLSSSKHSTKLENANQYTLAIPILSTQISNQIFLCFGSICNFFSMISFHLKFWLLLFYFSTSKRIQYQNFQT